MRASRVLGALAFAAACALPAMAKPREKNLINDFSLGKDEERIRLAPALGHLKDRKAVDALLLALDYKRGNPRESAAITDALGAAGDPRATVELSSGWDYLRTLTMQMGELPAHLQVLRAKILEALSRCGGEQASAILVEAVNDKDPRVVEEAVRGLGRLQVKDAVPALQQLAGQGGDMTQAVFEAFADIGDKRAVSTLEQGLANPDKFVEVEAAYALAKLGDKKMAARLEASLKNDPGAEKVGILAAYYLAKLDKSAGIAHLEALMNKKDSGYAVLAADALGKCGNPRAVLPLTEAARADDSSVRMSVARGLGLLGGARAVTALKKLAADANAGVRAAALGSLVALGESD
ncbi:MAG: HEAT repeat domain-containing protein [Elusimicrobia bacterium]|nr:HEAT repeat domain-containing protein [Elusimicrobiota bacterium]